jgi:nitroreductase
VSTAPVERATARAAIALANRAPSVHNTQPWQWRLGASSIHLFADSTRALPATDPTGRDLRISCGAALHHLRVALLAAGWSSTVHRLPDPAHPGHLAAIELSPGQPTAEQLMLAAAIEKRCSDRRVMSTWPLPDPLLAELERAAEAEGAALRVVTSEAGRRHVAALVMHASVEQSLTPRLAEETAAWSGRGRFARDGVPAANVPRAPDGTIPVRDFAAREQQQETLGRDEADGTVLALLATVDSSPLAELAAGEALSAVLLAATRWGVASDPISQPLEVPSTRAELRRRLLADQGEPQLLLRLGWASISAEPVPRTGRRPVDETIIALEASWETATGR